MTAGDDIAPEENLGRDVFSSNQAKRAGRGKVPINIFLEREGEPRLSVDRLDLASWGEAAEIADRVAAGRGRTFYGWAVVDAETAARNGRQVTASRQLDNPYHADIVLPDTAVEDREEQKRHAQELADASVWRHRDNDS
ncbi:MAG: hypothetical protein OYH76_11660 [Defluviicoccus sp.]|nr:hypothetical protein [Defluviicoccus sp.]MDE0276542.1 hypothetical protein [Defluviicoccus sp.]